MSSKWWQEPGVAEMQPETTPGSPRQPSCVSVVSVCSTSFLLGLMFWCITGVRGRSEQALGAAFTRVSHIVGQHGMVVLPLYPVDKWWLSLPQQCLAPFPQLPSSQDSRAHMGQLLLEPAHSSESCLG